MTSEALYREGRELLARAAWRRSRRGKRLPVLAQAEAVPAPILITLAVDPREAGAYWAAGIVPNSLVSRLARALDRARRCAPLPALARGDGQLVLEEA